MSEKTKVGAVELEPCPFCRSTNCSLSTRVGAWKFAYCPDCLTEGPAMDSDSDAIAAWNRRATPAAQAEAVAWQVRRADGRIDGSPFPWEECTKELYDATLSTGRYAGYENGPRCEVRALAALAASSNGERS